MKKILSLCLLMVIAPVLYAQPLSKEEIRSAVDYLQKTRDAVFKATKGLSEAQLDFKAATNKWSVAEVTEHIAAAEDFLMTMIKDNVMKAPARTNVVDVKEIDEFILKAIPDRSRKVQAPEPLQPANRFGSTAASLKHFKANRAVTIQFVKQTKGLRDHAVDSPLGKPLDGYQWVLLIAAHSERHTKQIEEVKADPNFPKK